jgi:hypothetical protein
MLPFGVTIPATVPQGSEIPEGLMNNPVYFMSNDGIIRSKHVPFYIKQVYHFYRKIVALVCMLHYTDIHKTQQRTSATDDNDSF